MSDGRWYFIKTCANCPNNVDHPIYDDFCIKAQRKIPEGFDIPAFCKLPKVGKRNARPKHLP